MHSLVRWPNKGCTVVLTESITRERNYVRVKRPEEDESHRALRVIAQSDDEHYLRGLQVDDYGVVHFPIAQTSENASSLKSADSETRASSSGSNSSESSMPTSPQSSIALQDSKIPQTSRLPVLLSPRFSAGLRSSSLNSSRRCKTEKISTSSGVGIGRLLSHVDSAESCSATLSKFDSRQLPRLDFQQNRKLPVCSTTIGNSTFDTDSKAKSGVRLSINSGQTTSTSHGTLKSSTDSGSRVEVTRQSRLPVPPNSPDILKHVVHNTPDVESNLPHYVASRSLLRSTSPSRATSGSTTDSSQSCATISDLFAISLFGANCSRSNDTLQTRVLWSSHDRAPTFSKSSSKASFQPPSPQLQSAAISHQHCADPFFNSLPSPLRSRSFTPGDSRSYTQTSTSFKSLGKSFQSSSPQHRSTAPSHRNYEDPFLNSLPSPIRSSNLTASDNRFPRGGTHAIRRLAIPLSPLRDSRNNDCVPLVEGTTVFINRERLKQILKETVYCREGPSDAHELVRQLMKAIVGIPQLMTMTPKGNSKSNLGQIPPQIYHTVFDYVTTLLPLHPLTLDKYRVVLGKMCTELRAPKRR